MSRVNLMHPADRIGDPTRADFGPRRTALRTATVSVAMFALGLLTLPALAASATQAPTPATPAAHAKKVAKGPAQQTATPFVSPYARAAAQHARAPQTAGGQGPTAMQAAGKHSPRTVTKRH